MGFREWWDEDGIGFNILGGMICYDMKGLPVMEDLGS